MKKHPSFINTAVLTKYSQGEYRVVSYEKLEVGQTLEIAYANKTILEILEERDSLGDFTGYEIPKSYRIKV